MANKLYLIGIGPGDLNYLAPLARKALEASQHWVAYQLYLDLLEDIRSDQSLHCGQLGAETARAKEAIRLARTQETTALISSGDIGIYAMATLVYELLDQTDEAEGELIDIEVIPGISAMQAAAARMGAPLAHDFCTISLSDLLTDWAVIEKRLRAAAEGDFVVAFYNPVSKQRDWQLEKALSILASHRPAETPVVIGRNLCREDEQVRSCSLADVDTSTIDMLTMVIVGNSDTRQFEYGGTQRVYTPRGYQKRLSEI